MPDEDPGVIERRADLLVDNHMRLMADLIAVRKKHGLSQAVVAARMSVSQPTVAGFERYDSNPTLSTIRRYALAVGARIEERVVDDCVGHQVEPDLSTIEAVFSMSPHVLRQSASRLRWDQSKDWGSVPRDVTPLSHV